MKIKFIPAVITVFVILCVALYLLHTSNPAFSLPLLMGGNIIMLALGLISYLLVKGKANGRAQAFVNGVNSASLLKIMVCIMSLLVYVLLNRKGLYKPSLFVLFGIYAAYTFVETVLLSKMARDGK